MGTVLGKLVVGAIAGLLAWMVIEPGVPAIQSPRWEVWEGTLILVLGAMVGLAVGGLDGLTRGGKVHTLRGAAVGLLGGAIGASLGHKIGGGLAHGIFGPAVFLNASPAAMIVQMPARVLALAPIGLFLGLAVGAASLNGKKAMQGAVGGLLGGAIAGALFDPIGKAIGDALLPLYGTQQAEIGGPSRAVFCALIGGMTALFIGLVERATRTAWLRLELGRNEGKEWSIDSAQTFLGRSESATVPLFGDMNVAPVHASITRANGQYILTDGGSPIGTGLNGQRVQQAPLAHGAQIQIGAHRLTFLTRNPRAAVPVPQPAAYVPAPAPTVPGAVQGQTVAFTAGAPMGATVAFPANSVSGFHLVVLDGPLAGRSFPVAGAMELGRESAAVPMAYDANASRRHASVVPGIGGLTVTDLGSTNGTFVNGQRVQTSAAPPGAILKIGNTSFRVEAG